MTPPVALTIAGSDSGGGAGIQADLKTFSELGAFGTSAVTALTAQNTVSVEAVHPVASHVVVSQIDAVLDDFEVAAVKTGMLATAETLDAVAALFERRPVPHLVIDPVLVSSSGTPLLDPGATSLYLHRLFPHSTAATPNEQEARALLGTAPSTLSDVVDAANQLCSYGPRMVVITGVTTGTGGGEAVDVVACDGQTHVLRTPLVATANDHGTGCTFSAALAAGLAAGMPPLDSARRAKSYVHGALRRAASWHLGAGHGPLDHNRLECR